MQAESIRQRYLKIDTATVADVLDAMGYPDCGLAPEFRPYPADAGKMAGWAYTICGGMRPYAGSGDPDKMKAVDGLRPGEISVWGGAGEGVCFFGELIALGMKMRGCAGALIDGGIRDIHWIAKQKFPVYARYRTPVQSIGRWSRCWPSTGTSETAAPVQTCRMRDHWTVSVSGSMASTLAAAPITAAILPMSRSCTAFIPFSFSSL